MQSLSQIETSAMNVYQRLTEAKRAPAGSRIEYVGMLAETF